MSYRRRQRPWRSSAEDLAAATKVLRPPTGVDWAPAGLINIARALLREAAPPSPTTVDPVEGLSHLSPLRYHGEVRADLAPTEELFAGRKVCRFKNDLAFAWKQDPETDALAIALNKAEEMRVDPRTLYASQSWVSRQRVREYLDGLRNGSTGVSGEKPWIVPEDGVLKVVDGHHRLARDILEGKTQTSVLCSPEPLQTFTHAWLAAGDPDAELSVVMGKYHGDALRKEWTARSPWDSPSAVKTSLT
jgi:hypothetical protein